MAYKMNFSIPTEDEEVYKKIKNMKTNKSRYIVDLIKADMGIINTKQSITEEKIIELINKKIDELALQIPQSKLQNQNNENIQIENMRKKVFDLNDSDDDDFL